MATNYVQNGDVMPFTLTGTVAADDVVVAGQTLGIALEGGASGDVIPLKISGVFSCPKVSAAVIKAGEALVWDSSAGAFDDNAASPATGDVSGGSVSAFADAAATTTTLLVRFNGVPGTVA
ncbi:MAG TPA: DUF2190 family protein [Woeseiaceae bacterium]